MFRQSIRRFGTTALRAAEGSTAYATRVSTAQGYVNGLTEGILKLPTSGPESRFMYRPYILTIIFSSSRSHWQHPSHSSEASF